MASVERTVYLISEQQREALLGYLQERPYREVAAGIQFLLNAPTASVNVDMPETSSLESGAASEETVEAETRELAAV
ncbi:MAG: hypothetical protein VKJ24_18665 [Synechococcales bacterium]|nr:hypothetical protein [Synechococcales bacterium]